MKRIRAPINITSNVNPLTLDTDHTWISQIVLTVQDSGTNWTLRIEDRDDEPHVIVPTFTVSRAPGFPADVLFFAQPLFMVKGINIFTTGNAGKMTLWIHTEIDEQRTVLG